jgi:uncharacterized protein DUF4440
MSVLSAGYDNGMDALAQELIQAERRGWDALCSDDAVSYYETHLTEDAVMAFPFGIMQREEALNAMTTAEPWSQYDMKDPTVLPLGPNSGVVVYRVTARREGQEPFPAILSSNLRAPRGSLETGLPSAKLPVVLPEARTSADPSGQRQWRAPRRARTAPVEGVRDDDQ